MSQQPISPADDLAKELFLMRSEANWIEDRPELPTDLDAAYASFLDGVFSALYILEARLKRTICRKDTSSSTKWADSPMPSNTANGSSRPSWKRPGGLVRENP